MAAAHSDSSKKARAVPVSQQTLMFNVQRSYFSLDCLCSRWRTSSVIVHTCCFLCSGWKTECMCQAMGTLAVFKMIRRHWDLQICLFWPLIERFVFGHIIYIQKCTQKSGAWYDWSYKYPIFCENNSFWVVVPLTLWQMSRCRLSREVNTLSGRLSDEDSVNVVWVLLFG